MKRRRIWVAYVLAAVCTAGVESALNRFGPQDCLLQNCGPWILVDVWAPVLILVLFSVILTRRVGKLRISAMAALAASATVGMGVVWGAGSDDNAAFVLVAAPLGFLIAWAIVAFVSSLVRGLWPSAPEDGRALEGAPPGSAPDPSDS